MAREIRWLTVFVLLIGTTSASARAPSRVHEPSPLQERGADVGKAYLLEFYHALPQPMEDEEPKEWAGRFQIGLVRFRRQVEKRYTEGTLQRLLDSDDVDTRRAAVLALGLIGSMASNAKLAGRLRDEDAGVRQLASDAAWSIWFRADSEANNRELQRLRQLDDPRDALRRLNALVRRAPNFAEAYNQRAIIHFRLGDFARSIADCEKALKLNPYHFGAQAGMAQCYLKLNKPSAALRAFRAAHRLNPNMAGIEQTIRALEAVLGEEDAADDRR